MLLTIDIGNSNITLGGFIGEDLQFMSRLYTDSRRTEDQYAVELLDILRLHNFDRNQVQDCAISSVVPELSRTFQKVCTRLFSVPPLLIGPGIKSGVKIGIDDPSQLGADLVAGAAAAMAKYPLPCIIIDLGTATTLSVIDQNGLFRGGTIGAGMGITLEALTSRTALLPHVSIERPKSVIGTNSIMSMQAGLVLGTAAMLDGLCDRIEEELGMPCTVVATGGLAHEMIPSCKRKLILDDNLLLDGLHLIYEKNRLRH